MTTVSARRVGSRPWWVSSSVLKWALATEWGVGIGSAGGSGEMLLRGDLPVLGLLGDRMLAELARRDGATPAFAECSEFMEAFRSRVGVADRDGGAMEAEELRSGLRMALPGRGVLGERSAAGGRGLAPAGREERGDLAGEEVEVVMVRRFKDCARSPSPWGPSLL
jgi:hypothetical protein